MDPELLLAYQEVDALTPATPPIAPIYGPAESPYAIGFPDTPWNRMVQAQEDRWAAAGVSPNSAQAANLRAIAEMNWQGMANAAQQANMDRMTQLERNAWAAQFQRRLTH